MGTERRGRQKILEWIRRYLPNEIAGTIAELGSAGAVYLYTGSLAAAAVAGTIFSSVGYYGAAYLNAVRWAMPDQPGRIWLARFARANLLALCSIAIEFGPAEAIDSLVIRPSSFYLFPLLTGSMAWGLVIGKIVADIGFYACTICSYERFRQFLVVRRTERRECNDALLDEVAVP